jgi:acyl transferase domain-containing protein/acyl carrier protein
MSDAKPPIAIVGMQGRFPGNAPTPDAFWSQLLDPTCFSADVPANRWANRRFATEDLAAGKTSVSRGYFLDYPFQSFDPDVFGFPPEEIANMDPQQRLILEVAWEALELAGFDPSQLSGSTTGVYVGGFTSDYLLSQFSSQARVSLGRYSASGSTLTMLSNRLSYALDVHGPSVTVDTACASSLSALSIAVRDLQAGLCPMALVGGVNFMLRPEYPIAMSAARLLANDGRSKPFSALADGYGRGEGCGFVILKPLEQAQSDGDCILALIAAAGTGHDGRTAGISLPNGAAQHALMRQVLDAARLDPAAVGYVEAHGTGTAQGDPIEARSIGATYGRGRATPLPIGSLKANIGHLEAAAGMAGIIKAVLMLRSRMIPPHLLIGPRNPAIAFDALNLRLPMTPEPLQGDHIAINAFGYGGSTAHVILSAAPEVRSDAGRPQRTVPPAPDGRDAILVPLTAQSETALAAWLPRLADQVADGVAPSDLAYTLARRRQHGTHRAAVWLDAWDTAEEHATAIRNALASPSETQGRITQEGPPKTLFVFAGMGPQWAGMGRDLWQASPVFRAALQDVDAAFRDHSGISIIDALTDPARDADMRRCRTAQPANFAMQIGLFQSLAAHGLQPDMCLGHSAGEVAAAWASGHLDLAQAVALCWARSELQDQCAGYGGMLAVDLDPQAGIALCADWPGLEIAAINGPRSITISGPDKGLTAARAALRKNGHVAVRLKGDIAYHSADMDLIMAPMRARLGGLKPHQASCVMLSSVTAQEVHGADMTADYWCRNLRDPVLFKQALERALDLGVTHCVEISAQPVLQKAIRSTAKSAFRPVRTVAALDRTSDQLDALRQAVARHYVSGGALDWARLAPQGTLADLPPTGWQRQFFWHEAAAQADDRLAPIDGTIMAEPGPVPHTWIADLNTQALGFLTQHRIEGVSVLPGAASIEAAVQTVRATQQDRTLCLHDIRLEAPFALDRRRGQILDTRCTGHSIETLAYDPAEPASAQRVLSAEVGGSPPPKANDVQISNLAAQAPYSLDIVALRKRLAAMGLGHAESFQTVTRLSMTADGASALVQVSVPPPLWQDGAFVLHPSLIDGIFQAGLALTISDSTLVPVRVKRCDVHAPLPARVWAWISIRPEEDTGPQMTFDAALYSDDGGALAHLSGIEVTALHPDVHPTPLPDLCLQMEWHPAALPEPMGAAVSVHIVTAHDTTHASGLRQAFQACDEQCSQTAPTQTATVFLAFGRNVDLADLLTTVLSQAQRQDQSRLYIVTDQAWAIASGSDEVNPQHAAIWGLGRTLYTELAARNTTLIDVVESEDWHSDVAREVLMNHPSTEVAFRAGQRLLPCLRPLELADATPVFRSNATYLITGGLGGLGRALAIWATRQGAVRLVLSTRKQPDWADVLPLRRTLNTLGADLEIVALDLTDADAVQDLIRRIDGPDHALAGIFHWAGQTQDGLAQDMTADDVQAVCAPKCTGAAHLHLASLGCELDHFVMASSLSALVGNQRQANYAAANAYLDGLAWQRALMGLPALSVNFGAVSGSGMAADPRVAAHLRAAGLPAMTAAIALAGLGAVMAGGKTQVALAKAINLPRWMRYDPRAAATDKMADVVGDAGVAPDAPRTLASRMDAAPAQARAALLCAHLGDRLAEIMGCPPDRLVADRPLARQGLDSLAAVEFQMAIEQDTGISFPIIGLIGGQSLAQVAQQISKAWEEPKT